MISWQHVAIVAIGAGCGVAGAIYDSSALVALGSMVAGGVVGAIVPATMQRLRGHTPPHGVPIPNGHRDNTR